MAGRCIAPSLVALALALAVGACGSSRIPGPTGTPYRAYMVGQPYQINGRTFVPREDFDYDRSGTASWYGSDFHGRRTANGETYDMHALTAAHPTLPMPTIVRVTNLDNGRSVTVRINDRGPFAEDRIIDLSRAGARELGFESAGLARVRVSVLREASLQLKRAAGVADSEESREAILPNAPQISARPEAPR